MGDYYSQNLNKYVFRMRSCYGWEHVSINVRSVYRITIFCCLSFWWRNKDSFNSFEDTKFYKVLLGFIQKAKSFDVSLPVSVNSFLEQIREGGSAHE